MLIFPFIFGICVGSFLNVLADRLPKGESIWKGRSHCESCKKILAWYDLVPLLSFLSIRGKCRYCHVRLSFYYPLIEIVTGILFVIIGNYELGIMNYAGNYLVLLFYLFITSAFIVLFFTDLRYGILPDIVIFPAIVATLLFLILNSQFMLLNSLFSAFGACLFFFFLFLLTKGKGMGFGDVKLSFLLGLFLGFPLIIVGLYAAFLTGATIASILVLCRRKKLFGSTIPFGPFLIVGSGVGLLWGEQLLQFFFRGIF